MAHHFADYESLKAYWLDLSARVEKRDKWLVRHPDFRSEDYEDDGHGYRLATRLGQAWVSQWGSTFAPADDEPDTYDIFRAETLTQIMHVALAAYEAATNTETAITNARLLPPL